MDRNDFDFSETSFKYLMQKRINKVLVVCSNYDFFMLEEDGRIDEKIYDEYVSLNLRYPPFFIHAQSAAEALAVFKTDKIDLVISMLSTGSEDAFSLSKKIKARYRDVPIVVLTPFSREVSLKLVKEDLSAIDYVFCWLGDTGILLAIIKLIEDKMNVDYDALQVGVQVILLVEDSVRFYSSYLPNLYQIILYQSKEFMTEGLNSYRSMLTMRGRPKVLLATNYEDALYLFNRYRDNVLGVISDVSFKREGVKDTLAGIRLASKIRESDPSMPILLQSSDLANKVYAERMNLEFIHKFSKTMNLELKDHIIRDLAFGDFVFRMPDETEIARASNLQNLQKMMMQVPFESLAFHFGKNDFSRWLNARALFPLAKKLKKLKSDDFPNIDVNRDYIYKLIKNFRLFMGRGVIAQFDREKYDEYLSFSRIGNGSLGGKARGLAFIDSFLNLNQTNTTFKDVVISIPRTLVICTDIFDQFMEENNLYHIGLSNASDQEILDRFIQAALPEELEADLRVFVSVVKKPIAVRSSSLLEDSHHQPFAGVYSTYMIPNVPDRLELTLKMLSDSIKSVYASVYYKDSKHYMAATQNMIDEEKMGIVLQEVCGSAHEGFYYPTVSGVARSINFYPIEPEQSQDGIAKVALGLGKITVEGGVTLRFSPSYPNKILQLSSPDMALKETQKFFYALDLNPDSFTISTDDGVNIKKLSLKDAEKHRSLKHVASTFDRENNRIRDSLFVDGRRVITFNNILQHKTFPLAEILQHLLSEGEKEMNNPIEIEFAVELDVPQGSPKIFNYLQIRPIVEQTENVNIDLEGVQPEQTIVLANKALGNGVVQGVKDIVYVKPESFNPSQSHLMAEAVERINKDFVARDGYYVLIGPGRWGSSDPWLGIPVKWSQISNARLIIESGLEHFRIDPSQGTHFFQNLTSFKVGYFTINPYNKDGFYDIDYLAQRRVVYEDAFLRHISFDDPLVIKIDGKRNKGVIYKPVQNTINEEGVLYGEE